MTVDALRAVPFVKKEDEKKPLDMEEEVAEVADTEIHPEVSVHSSFKYKPGKPDRPKKVERFFVTEEERLLKLAQREAEEGSRMRANEETKPLRGRIYFDSIKSKIPKLVTTEELKKRKKVVEEKKAKGGKNVIVRKGSLKTLRKLVS